MPFSPLWVLQTNDWAAYFPFLPQQVYVFLSGVLLPLLMQHFIMGMVFPIPLNLQVVLAQSFIGKAVLFHHTDGFSVSWHNGCLNAMKLQLIECNSCNSCSRFSHVSLAGLFFIQLVAKKTRLEWTSYKVTLPMILASPWFCKVET